MSVGTRNIYVVVCIPTAKLINVRDLFKTRGDTAKKNSHFNGTLAILNGRRDVNATCVRSNEIFLAQHNAHHRTIANPEQHNKKRNTPHRIFSKSQLQ